MSLECDEDSPTVWVLLILAVIGFCVVTRACAPVEAESMQDARPVREP